MTFLTRNTGYQGSLSLPKPPLQAGTLKLDGIIIETCAGKGRDRVPRGVHDISAARP